MRKLIVILIIIVVILTCMWKYGLGVKMTEEEKKHVMHGDNWLAPDEPKIRYDGGITINAPAEKVWPYIVQAGQTKALRYPSRVADAQAGRLPVVSPAQAVAHRRGGH